MANGDEPMRKRPAEAKQPSVSVTASPGESPAATSVLVDEELVEEARMRRPMRPSGRDLATSALLGGGFLAAAVAMAVLLPWDRPLSLAALAVLVAAYAILSRVEFEVGPGWAVPTQLVFVPMLFVLPVPLVPLCVAGGYLLGALPDYSNRRVHPARSLVLLSSSWYAVGPAIVFSLFRTETPTWRHVPIYLVALAAQFALDAASSSVRERTAFGHSPRALLPSFAWLWAIDSFLAAIGLAAALNGTAGVLVVLPVVGLLSFMARDRRARIDRAVTVGQAYRGAVDEAHSDDLTGIGNRRKLLSDLERVSAEAANESALIIYDLNGFKHYNDTFGHPAGDALLRRLAGKLAAAADTGYGTAYRLGGDEFAVLAAPPADAVEDLLDATVRALAEEGEGFSISACFGAVFIPSEGRDSTSALRIADQRLYAQKHTSKLRTGHPHLALLEALFERDPDLRTHVSSVTSLSGAVARRLGVEGHQLVELTVAAQLHDVGKIAIPDAVLHKPGPLTDEEWALMRQHTVIGQRILGAVPALRGVGTIVRATHERWDGTGYIDGLAGEAIPLAARIIAVCDAFEAMTAIRPYAAPAVTTEALDELRRCAGTQFDPEVVRAFCDVVSTQGRDRLVAAAAA
jgi:diguanylate cyclase (GGDEF)-like protein